MHERVKAYIDNQKRIAEEQKNKKKAEKLVDLGLFDVVYKPEGENASLEYCIFDAEKQNYYKMIPIEVTDEEYNEILKYEVVQEKNTKNFSIVSVLGFFGWLFICIGFFYGIFAGAGVVAASGFILDEVFSGSVAFSLGVAISIWAPSLLYGSLLLGFAKIIDLLQEIKNK